MPRSFQLDDQQLSQWERDGLLRLEGLLDPHSVALARQAVLHPLERLGLWRDGRWRLDRRPAWPDQGLKPARDIGHRHPDIEALIRLPTVRAVVDRLLDDAEVDQAVYRRPQVLASLPNAGPWVLPDGWHTDMPRLASGRCPGIQLFTFLDSVRPRGGGTLVVAGSHRLLNDGRDLKVREIRAALRSEPFFRALFGEHVSQGQTEPLPAGRVHGVRLEVVELVGEPGDVWIMDLRALHAAAPNCSDRPRLMATHRFVRTDRMPEVAAAFGWR